MLTTLVGGHKNDAMLTHIVLAATFEQRVASPGITGDANERGKQAAHSCEGPEGEGEGERRKEGRREGQRKGMKEQERSATSRMLEGAEWG